MAIKFVVTTIESERGWGRKYETSEFDTYEAAKKYRDHVNSQNTSETVPDWYMIAENEIRVKEY